MTPHQPCCGQTPLLIHKKHAFLCQQLRPCRPLPASPPHSEVQHRFLPVEPSGEDQTPVHCVPLTAEDTCEPLRAVALRSLSIDIRWKEAHYLSERRNRFPSAWTMLLEKTVPQINNSEHLGGQVRVTRMILDHLLPRCCLGGQAFHFGMWIWPYTQIQNQFCIKILAHNEAIHQLKYNCNHHISYIQCSVLFFNSTNALSKSNGIYLAVQPANGNRKNVFFAWLKYAVSSLSTSLHLILLILLLNQVLCIAPYTYAEKFYWGFYYFL